MRRERGRTPRPVHRDRGPGGRPCPRANSRPYPWRRCPTGRMRRGPVAPRPAARLARGGRPCPARPSGHGPGRPRRRSPVPDGAVRLHGLDLLPTAVGDGEPLRRAARSHIAAGDPSPRNLPTSSMTLRSSAFRRIRPGCGPTGRYGGHGGGPDASAKTRPGPGRLRRAGPGRERPRHRSTWRTGDADRSVGDVRGIRVLSDRPAVRMSSYGGGTTCLLVGSQPVPDFGDLLIGERRVRRLGVLEYITDEGLSDLLRGRRRLTIEGTAAIGCPACDIGDAVSADGEALLPQAVTAPARALRQVEGMGAGVLGERLVDRRP